MNRSLLILAFLTAYSLTLHASADRRDVGVKVATETTNGSVQQRMETQGKTNDLPYAESTLETSLSRPIPNSMRFHSEIRWVGNDAAAIGQDVATNANGTNTFVGWNLNNMRVSFHDNASNIPLWELYSDPNVYRNFVALSADAGIVANGSYHNIYLFDMNTGAITFDFTPEDERVAGPIAVSRDGSLLVCATI